MEYLSEAGMYGCDTGLLKFQNRGVMKIGEYIPLGKHILLGNGMLLRVERGWQIFRLLSVLVCQHTDFMRPNNFWVRISIHSE